MKKNPSVKVGDIIQIGTPLVGGEIFWGTNQVVTYITTKGLPAYRSKWGKVDKFATTWRKPPPATQPPPPGE
jgi:hypothetical protein